MSPPMARRDRYTTNSGPHPYPTSTISTWHGRDLEYTEFRCLETTPPQTPPLPLANLTFPARAELACTLPLLAICPGFSILDCSMSDFRKGGGARGGKGGGGKTITATMAANRSNCSPDEIGDDLLATLGVSIRQLRPDVVPLRLPRRHSVHQKLRLVYCYLHENLDDRLSAWSRVCVFVGGGGSRRIPPIVQSFDSPSALRPGQHIHFLAKQAYIEGLGIAPTPPLDLEQHCARRTPDHRTPATYPTCPS